MPPIAEGHRDPIVRELRHRLVKLYDCRRSLRSPLNDHRGGLILPAFPEFLQRPQKRVKKGEPPPPPAPDFERRRSDGMEAIVRVLLTIASCCDWVTMELHDPRGGYLSVPRLAELADLPVTLVPPKEEGGRTRKRHDRTDRALRAVRGAMVIAFTQQHREQLKDGRFTSTSPALRKLAVGLFRKFGGQLLRLFEKRRKKLQRQREAEGPTTGDLRIAATIRELGRDSMAAASSQAYSPLATGPRSLFDTHPELLDKIHDEHPEWSMSDLLREAQRQLERGPPPNAPPDNETN